MEFEFVGTWNASEVFFSRWVINQILYDDPDIWDIWQDVGGES